MNNVRKRYKLTFMYNGHEYDFEVKNQSCTDLDKTDAQIIVEAIIEKQIKYVEGQYVQGLNITEIESEQKKGI